MNNIELEIKVKSLVHSLKYQKGYVCSVDILMGLGCLLKQDYEDWRFGRVDYLEKVCKANLSKLSFINKSIRKFTSELKLEKSITYYQQYGKGAKRKLRFSKSGDNNIECFYATHYVDKVRVNELKMNKDGE
jgi:hypothetical protein